MASDNVTEMDLTEPVQCFGLQADPDDCYSQNKRISRNQLQNQVGGYVYQNNPEGQLRSFICTGSSSRNYRVRSHEPRLEDVPCVSQLIQQGKGKNIVQLLIHFSEGYRTRKDDPLLFVLAICCRSNDIETKKSGYSALNSICRIPTQLFRFLDFYKKIGIAQLLSKGWGSAHRKAICDWYLSYGTDEGKLKLLALHITKYCKRYGWRHKNVIRLAHLKVKEENPVLKYLVIVAVKGKKYADSTKFLQKQMEQEHFQNSLLKEIVDILSVIEIAKITKDVAQTKRLILKHRLVREQLPTSCLNDIGIWLALARHMPLTALVRNLGKMSKLELFKRRTSAEEEICFEEHLIIDKLKNKELLAKEMVHPFTYMLALSQYKKGENHSGKLKWPVYPQICSALEEGLYLSFINIKPTKKRFLLALDISKAMEESVNVVGAPTLQALEVAAFMSTLAIKTENNCEAIVFKGENVDVLPVSSSNTIEEVTENIRTLAHPMTDIPADPSWPFKYAIEKKKEYDIFVIYTDSNASLGNPHPSQALQFYRQATGNKEVRLVVCNLACSDVSIGDTEDPLTLTVCGFDSYVPQIISDFLNREF
ncbi:RNA-binding protein RO60-like [Saccostrea echinata]|uniref:RNA-binding protein RO60-like n=1 Tax=Saccostrea echinata TaxID=191078 RepID=UPI002A814EDE|nr:RNA-binding protein RO60-like [Saccostrea echinata]